MARKRKTTLSEKVADSSAEVGKKVAVAVDDTKAALDKAEGPSPNPMTNLILTDLLLRGGGQIMRHAVEGALLSTKFDKTRAKRIMKGRSLTQTLVSTAVARFATRSVPGAIIVGGASLAKLLYDRNQDKRAARKAGDNAIAKQEAKGK
ncbi:hypothetical protein ACFO0A_11800 [Novosphingobium tardum]|uniref:DUF4235 domain-containing protein n=1 Tax=Novosphingobium tardum TaxID=1538021 RepID=A0ABV8RQT2_9SPHN